MLRNILADGFRLVSRGASKPSESLSRHADFAPIERKMRGKIPEKRSQTGDFTGNFATLIDLPTGSGVSVNETSALNVAAVTACVGLLANMVAKLPLYLYQDTPKGPREIADHPAIQLIGKYPSEMHSSFELRQLMETGKGLGGNGYARVFRDVYGDPRAIQWLAPCDVQPKLVTRGNGENFVSYQVQGEKSALTRYDIIHVRGFSRDGICGISPIRMLRESIGTSLTQTSAAGKLMRNGAKFNGILSTESMMKPEQVDVIRNEWERNTSEVGLGRTPILTGSWKYQQTNGMTMVDAQFLESRRFELQEIARFYGVPTFLIGDTTNATSFGSGIEQMTLGFLNFCLDPHLVGWEQSLGQTLLTTAEQKGGFRFEFDRDELANVALEARANFYQTMRGIGVFSVNDVRAKLGEPLLTKKQGGDDYLQPFNNTGGAAQAKAEPAAKPEPATP